MLAGIEQDLLDCDFYRWSNVNSWMPEYQCSWTIRSLMRAVDDGELTKTYPYG